MSNKIHTSAVVESGAEIADDVQIGAFCYVGPKVKIDSGTILLPHSVVDGNTTIGKNNHFSPHCSIGSYPQDISYKGEDTKVTIGDNNIFREFVSVNRGTLKQDQETIIGNDNMFMAYSHIGHDVVIENKVRLVNASNLGGHVRIGEGSILSGATNVSQFVTVGKGAFIGGETAIDRDIPCYCTALGNRARLKGVNIIGLKRQGYDKTIVSEVVDFYRSMEASALSPRSFVDSQETIEEYSGNPIIEEMMQFIRESKIGIPSFM